MKQQHWLLKLDAGLDYTIIKALFCFVRKRQALSILQIIISLTSVSVLTVPLTL